jgi:hypothetical protein
VKAIKPAARVGWHVHHSVSWDLFYRAEADYAEMADYSDWIKPVVYHDVAGPRVHESFARAQKQRLLSELGEEQILGLLYAFAGYDTKTEPPVDRLMERGFSPEYVYREIDRVVCAVKGKVPIYAGVGFDIPWKQDRFPSDPDVVYGATVRAFEAGAAGLIVSREYDEMRLANLRAVRRGVRDAWKG